MCLINFDALIVLFCNVIEIEWVKVNSFQFVIELMNDQLMPYF